MNNEGRKSNTHRPMDINAKTMTKKATETQNREKEYLREKSIEQFKDTKSSNLPWQSDREALNV